tara:strand:+ start:286 stop:417 length:132 start_codon:yes stop_codon:yes gene_type:complete
MKNSEKKIKRKKLLEDEMKKNLIRRKIQKEKKIVIYEKERKNS